MRIEVRLPQWGMGISEGTVVDWFKSVGDRLSEGDALVEIETAKATDVVTAPVDGVLTEIAVQAGAVVAVNEVLAAIETMADSK